MSSLLPRSFNDFYFSKMLADSSLKLMGSGTESRVRMLVFIVGMHHHMQASSCAKALLAGYEAGRRSGDVESAAWNAYLYLDINLLMGTEIELMLKECKPIQREVENFGQLFIVINIKLLLQVLIDLSDPNSDKKILRNETFEENNSENRCSLTVH